jgi:hypothetical protein
MTRFWLWSAVVAGWQATSPASEAFGAFLTCIVIAGGVGPAITLYITGLLAIRVGTAHTIWRSRYRIISIVCKLSIDRCMGQSHFEDS